MGEAHGGFECKYDVHDPAAAGRTSNGFFFTLINQEKNR